MDFPYNTCFNLESIFSLYHLSTYLKDVPFSYNKVYVSLHEKWLYILFIFAFPTKALSS